MSSLCVQLDKFVFTDVARCVGVAFSDQFLNLCVCHRELQVVRKDQLKVVSGDVALVAFVEQAEALSGLFNFAILVPPDRHS